MTRIRTLFALLAMLGFSLLAGLHASVVIAATATEQAQAEVPEALSPEAISALVSRMDEEQRQALARMMELINSSVGAEAVGESAERARLFAAVETWIAALGNNFSKYIRQFPEMVVSVWRAFASIFDGRGLAGTAVFLALVVLALAVGAIAEWLLRRGTARWREQIKQASPSTVVEAWQTLSLRAAIEIGGVILFAVGALIATRIVFSSPADRELVSTLIITVGLIVRLADTVLRFVLAPHRPDLRLVSTDSWTAVYIYRNLVWITVFISMMVFLVTVMGGRSSAAAQPVLFWTSLIGHGWIIYATWRARRGLTAIIKGEDENLTPGLERMALWWPGLSMVVVAVNWLLMEFIASAGYGALTPGSGALALALIVMAPFLDTMIRGIAGHLVPAIEGEGEVAEKAYRETQQSYIRIGRVLLITVLVSSIAKIWGVSLVNLAQSGLGAQIGANLIGFLLILAVGYLSWEATNLWINRRLRKEMPDPGSEQEAGEPGGAGKSRMATILPILRMTLQAAIVTITVLLALSQLGLNITPLLAGAGVLGLAIGFGAQTLVKDVVSGVFFLLDDAFRIGEYVDVGGTEGSVEKISVRSLQLRGATGPVHIVPYGSISKLTNMSRDWVIMKLRFTVPFDTDLEKVRKIFKKIGQELQEVPEYAQDMIEPFKSQGAADVTDVGIVVRGKFTTKPGGQWVMRKEIYMRVQKAFEENGIEFARKEVRVQMPGQGHEAQNLTAEQKNAIAAAVSEAAEPAAPPAAPATRG